MTHLIKLFSQRIHKNMRRTIIYHVCAISYPCCSVQPSTIWMLKASPYSDFFFESLCIMFPLGRNLHFGNIYLLGVPIVGKCSSQPERNLVKKCQYSAEKCDGLGLTCLSPHLPTYISLNVPRATGYSLIFWTSPVTAVMSLFGTRARQLSTHNLSSEVVFRLLGGSVSNPGEGYLVEGAQG